MQRLMLAAVLATSALLLTGCGTVQGPSFSEARAPAPVNGKALVYVYRKHAEPTAWGGTIFFDRSEIATLNQGGFTWAHLSPGTHTVRAVWAGLSGQRDSLINLEVNADTTYYLELVGVSKLVGVAPAYPGIALSFQMGSGLNETDPARAEAIVAACCKFQSPKTMQ